MAATRLLDEVGRGLHALVPDGTGDDLRGVGAVLVAIGDVTNFTQQAL